MQSTLRPAIHPRTRSCLSLAGIPILLISFLLVACQKTETLDELRQRQARGEWTETLEPLRERLAESPEDAEAAFLYGRALVSTGQPSLAVWPLRRAMEDPEWFKPAGFQLAHAALYSRDFNEVVEVTTRILETYPEDETALLYRAQAHAHWKSHPDAALRDAQRVLELDPEVLEAYEPMILALIALERQDEAAEALEEVGHRLEEQEASSAQRAWHCSTTAVFALDAQEIDRAREILADCLERFPSDPTVVTNAVSFYDTQGEVTTSVEVLRRALEEGSGARGFRTALAEHLRQVGEVAEGEALLLELTQIAESPLRVSAWIDVATYRHAVGDPARAAEAIAEAIALVRERGDEPAPQLWFQYADALLVSGQLDAALDVAEKIEVPAQSGLIRARVAQERGQTEQAMAGFDEVLRVWPDNPAARYYAARAAESVGDFDRALEEYRYSIRISVGATDARTRAARLLVAEGRPLLAYQLLFIEARKFPLDPEGELLSMYLMGRVANPAQLQGALVALAARAPQRVPEALARGAEGAAETAGAAAGLSLIGSAPGLDLGDPRSAPALRTFVELAAAADRSELASRVVETAVARHPDSAALLAIRGLQLELAAADPAQVREAYAQATQIDSGQAAAWAGQARTLLEQDPEKALALFERAIAADPHDPELELARARVLRALGRVVAAADQLDALLERHPHAGEAAAVRAELDLDRGKATGTTLERARRAVRFDARPATYELLARVYGALHRTEEQTSALAQAERLRAAQNAVPAGS